VSEPLPSGPSSSQALAIRDELVSGQWSAVSELIGRHESLYLDFKENRGTSRLTTDNRKNLSKALSGFSNALGGVIVWGVKAKHDAKTGLDVADEILPVKSTAVLLSDLAAATAELVQFPIPGVTHTPIHGPDEPGAGLVLTYVPAIDDAPRMAMTDHSYYRRTSNTFRHLEHYEVAELFARRGKPRLSVLCFWSMQHQGPTQARLSVQFMVENVSREMAHYPCLTIRQLSWNLVQATSDADVGGPFRRVDPPHGWTRRYRGNANDVMIPGDRYNVAAFLFHVNPSADPSPPPLRVEYEIATSGMPVERATYEISAEAIKEGITVCWNTGSYRSGGHP
jgi:hypothetical protein